jgi:hypothetical protein
MQYNTFWILWGLKNSMEMPGSGSSPQFWFQKIHENTGTKAQLPKLEVTRKHWVS